jgi:endonuclease IV
MSRIGVHVAKTSKVLTVPLQKRKTMLDAITQDCTEFKLGCCQIFVAGPANTKMNDMIYPDIANYCDAMNIKLYVHSSYLTIGIFGINTENKETAKAKASIKHLIQQLEACDALNAKGFIVHLPRKEPQVVIDTLRVILPIIDKYNTPLVFEMSASKADPDKTYETPEKINRLSDMIIAEYPNFINWYWCPDTAHLYSSGVDVSNYKIMSKWFKSLSYPEKIGLFHLNGASFEQYESGKDIHRVVFASDDNIWNTDANISMDEGNIDIKKIKTSSIYIIAKFAKKYNIDLICEINRGEYKEINYSIKSLQTIFD